MDVHVYCSCLWCLAFLIIDNLVLITHSFHLLMFALNSEYLNKLLDKLSDTADILNNTQRIAHSPVICTQLAIDASPAGVM